MNTLTVCRVLGEKNQFNTDRIAYANLTKIVRPIMNVLNIRSNYARYGVLCLPARLNGGWYANTASAFTLHEPGQSEIFSDIVNGSKNNSYPSNVEIANWNRN
jgi:hypothetical protein